MTPTRTPTSRPRRNLLSEMPAEVIALCLDELDAPDLGRLCLVSRAFRDALSTPTTWTRQAAKSLCTEEYGPLPGNMSRVLIARQHVRDRGALRRGGARCTPKKTGENAQRDAWQEDWSLPICHWLHEPRSVEAR